MVDADQLVLPTAAGVATLQSLGPNSNVDLLLGAIGNLRGQPDATSPQVVNIGGRPGCAAPCPVEFGKFTRPDPGASLSREWTTRVDYNATPNDNIFVRYTDSFNSLSPDLFANPGALPSQDTRQSGPSRLLGGMWAHTFGPKVVVLEQSHTPLSAVVIFVTAYDKYAIQAFEAHALDYLLKPFDFERFERALSRARIQIAASRSGEPNEKLLAILESRNVKAKYLDRLAIKSRGRVIFLKTGEIAWIEAAGNYLELHSGKESHLIREPIGDFEQRLNPERFIRIHRSCIVNVEHIKELQPGFGGEYLVVMNDGQQLTASRGYRDRLQQLLSNER